MVGFMDRVDKVIWNCKESQVLHYVSSVNPSSELIQFPVTIS